MNDKEIYILACTIISGLSCSLTVLVGANARLLAADVCRLLTDGMRAHCSSCAGGAIRWSHFSPPYSCKVCAESCYAIYCLALSEDTRSKVINDLKRYGITGLIVRPVILLCKDPRIRHVFEQERTFADFRFNFDEFLSSSGGVPLTSLSRALVVHHEQEEQKLPGNSKHSKKTVNTDSSSRALDKKVTSEKELISEFILPSGSNAIQRLAVAENLKYLLGNTFVNVDLLHDLQPPECDVIMAAIFSLFNIVHRG
jgi:hypothetical protein